MTTPTPIPTASGNSTQSVLQRDGLSSSRAAAPKSIKFEAPQQSIGRAHLNLDTFSPVMQNGCFEFDRVIKSGQVLKRTRKTKSWKSVFLVLRPNLLSIYKDSEGTKLRHQLILSDLTAVARQRDPKRKGHHVFGLFSPSRNYHIETASERDAQEWVESIRREARIDEEDETMILMSPGATREREEPFRVRERGTTMGASSSEDSVACAPSAPRAITSPRDLHSARRPSNTVASFSGNEGGSFSDFSDPGLCAASRSDLSAELARMATRVPGEHIIYGASTRPDTKRHVSTKSIMKASSQPEERVVHNDWLRILKSTGGVKQWRSVWAVLRPKTFAIYKNEEEYSASLIIPFSNIIDAVDIDQLSRTKVHCFQLIAEEKNYRFCAMSEDELARWLGAFKSLLAKRKEGELRGGGGTVVAP